MKVYEGLGLVPKKMETTHASVRMCYSECLLERGVCTNCGWQNALTVYIKSFFFHLIPQLHEKQGHNNIKTSTRVVLLNKKRN